jgi:hypothetical protein
MEDIRSKWRRKEYMVHLVAILAGLSFVVIYKNVVETKRIRQQVVYKTMTKTQWHHAAGMLAIVLNVPQLVQASIHPNVIYAFGGLLVLSVWFGMKHRSEGLHHIP